MRPSVGACTILQKMINGFLCVHIVLNPKEGIIIKFTGQVKTEYISMATDR